MLLNKTTILINFITIAIFLFSFARAPAASAIFGMGDIVIDPVDISQDAAHQVINKIIETGQEIGIKYAAEEAKKSAVKAVAREVGKALLAKAKRIALDKLLKSITGWLETGELVMPEPYGFLKGLGFGGKALTAAGNVLDEASGEALGQLTGIDWCVAPQITAKIKVAVSKPLFQEVPKCKLSQATKAQLDTGKKFFDEIFNQPDGWKNFIELSAPTNNFFGEFFGAIAFRENQAELGRNKFFADLAGKGGFIDQRVCVEGKFVGGVYPDKTVNVVTFVEMDTGRTNEDRFDLSEKEIEELARKNNWQILGEIRKEPIYDGVYAEQILQQGKETRKMPPGAKWSPKKVAEEDKDAFAKRQERFICTRWETVTPGRYVGDLTAKTIGSRIDWLMNSDETSAFVGAIVDSAISGILSGEGGLVELIKGKGEVKEGTTIDDIISALPAAINTSTLLSEDAQTAIPLTQALKDLKKNLNDTRFFVGKKKELISKKIKASPQDDLDILAEWRRENIVTAQDGKKRTLEPTESGYVRLGDLKPTQTGQWEGAIYKLDENRAAVAVRSGGLVNAPIKMIFTKPIPQKQAWALNEIADIYNGTARKCTFLDLPFYIYRSTISQTPTNDTELNEAYNKGKPVFYVRKVIAEDIGSLMTLEQQQKDQQTHVSILDFFLEAEDERYSLQKVVDLDIKISDIQKSAEDLLQFIEKSYLNELRSLGEILENLNRVKEAIKRGIALANEKVQTDTVLENRRQILVNKERDKYDKARGFLSNIFPNNTALESADDEVRKGFGNISDVETSKTAFTEALRHMEAVEQNINNTKVSAVINLRQSLIGKIENFLSKSSPVFETSSSKNITRLAEAYNEIQNLGQQINREQETLKNEIGERTDDSVLSSEETGKLLDKETILDQKLKSLHGLGKSCGE